MKSMCITKYYNCSTWVLHKTYTFKLITLQWKHYIAFGGEEGRSGGSKWGKEKKSEKNAYKASKKI